MTKLLHLCRRSAIDRVVSLKHWKIIFLASLFTALLATVQPCSAAPREVVVVQSADIKPFTEAIAGFEATCNCYIKEIITVTPENTSLISQIHRLRPDAILALGSYALSRVQEITDIPIFYTMTITHHALLPEKNSLSGVSMLVAPEKQAELIRILLPKAKRIGIVYDQSSSGLFMERLIQVAKAQSLEIVARRARTSQELPQLLEEMKGKVDAILMLPDIKLITNEAVEAMLLFSFRNSVPVISFSDKYLSQGALASITISPKDLGAQTGSITAKYAGRAIREYGSRARLTINAKIAKKLGIAISGELLKRSLILE